MAKADFKKTLKHLYSASAKEPVIVDVPTMNFAMVDGTGDPNGSTEFQQAMEVLYPISYTLKFMLKKSGGLDYAVPPPEGLWWMEGESGFDMRRKDLWRWTLMVMQPEVVTPELFAEAVAQVKAKRNPPGRARRAGLVEGHRPAGPRLREPEGLPALRRGGEPGHQALPPCTRHRPRGRMGHLRRP